MRDRVAHELHQRAVQRGEHVAVDPDVATDTGEPDALARGDGRIARGALERGERGACGAQPEMLDVFAHLADLAIELVDLACQLDRIGDRAEPADERMHRGETAEHIVDGACIDAGRQRWRVVGGARGLRVSASLIAGATAAGVTVSAATCDVILSTIANALSRRCGTGASRSGASTSSIACARSASSRWRTILAAPLSV